LCEGGKGNAKWRKKGGNALEKRRPDFQGKGFHGEKSLRAQEGGPCGRKKMKNPLFPKFAGVKKGR